MASWTVTSQGSTTATPNTSNQNGVTSYGIPTDESFVLQEIKAGSAYILTSDAPRTVNIDPCSAVTFLDMQVIGGYVDVTLTPTIKPAFTLRLSPYIYLRCDDDPILSITLTRPPSVEVTVNVFLGQKS
jgi:hypothetical protein